MRVLGRVGELAALDAFLADLGSGAPAHRVVLVVGEAGIGKTMLWDAGRACAAARDCHVLTARPVAPESALGFTGLADLFEDVPAEAIDQLPGPQRHALRVALLREEAGAAPADPRSVATGTLTALRALAGVRPVLLAVDDLAWLDASTRRVLAFALRRLGAERVGLLATVRTHDGSVPELPTDDVPAARVHTITPAPLSLGAVRELLAERLRFAPHHRLLVRIYEASGGNPYFAQELSRLLVREDASHLDAELTVPDSLRRLVHRRLAGLPHAVRDVLLGAALEPSPPVELVAAAAADPQQARSHLEAAVEAGVVEARRSEVTFTHPLLRSVLIDDAPPRQRRATHARLAQAVGSPLARARHRALAADGPDEDVARALDEAAGTARLRGSTETAADLAELAITLTPPDNGPGVRTRRLAAAELRFDAGEPGRARTALDDLLRDEPPGPRRAPLLLQLAKYQRYSGQPLPVWQRTLESALAEARADDLRAQMAAHFALGFAAFNGGDPETAPAHIAAFTDLAGRLDDRFLDAQVAASLAYVRWACGDRLRVDLLDRALRAEPAQARIPIEETPSYTAAVALAHRGDIARARELVDRDRADAVARGDEASLPILGWLLVRLETWAGNWTLADRYADEALQAAELAEIPFGIASVRAARAILRAAQGRAADARADAAVGLDVHARTGLSLPGELADEALGLLALAAGDAARALAAVDGATDRALRAGFVQLGMLRTIALEIEARIRARDTDVAQQLLDQLLARCRPEAGSWPQLAVRRCTALLLSATGAQPGAEQAIADALATGRALGMPFEHARTLLVAGEIHRRARHRRQAQQSLTEAKRLFDQLGAQPWSGRCAELLTRIAGRSNDVAPDPTALTDTEHRVADLAAQGLTSREIAGALFTGVRTVETHLQQVYRKLGVRSRVELSRRFAMHDT